MTTSHDSFLNKALFMNTVASSFKKDILAGSNLLRAIFSRASSKAGNDVSIPQMIGDLSSFVRYDQGTPSPLLHLTSH